ncbi:MAG TPA: carboxypeptidase regulatory-like domain-containing protein [Opitutaceae bacterium]|jgi:plastocyanin
MNTNWSGAARTAVLLALVAPVACPAASAEGKVALPKAMGVPAMNKRYGIVSYNGVLSPYPPRAVVYLEGAFPKAAPKELGRMEQKDLNFVPAVLPVQVGTRVEFPNLDDTYHNIFSYSPAKRFDLGRYRSDERPIPSVLFDVAGMVTVRCDIHEHMRAIILVLDTPYFVVTGTDGSYRLPGLPAGRFVLKAWLDSKTTLERPVELADGAPLHVDFP